VTAGVRCVSDEGCVADAGSCAARGPYIGRNDNAPVGTSADVVGKIDEENAQETKKMKMIPHRLLVNICLMNMIADDKAANSSWAK